MKDKNNPPPPSPRVPWMISSFPDDLRRQFVARCLCEKITVSSALERIIRKEVELSKKW